MSWFSYQPKSERSLLRSQEVTQSPLGLCREIWDKIYQMKHAKQPLVSKGEAKSTAMH